MAKLYMRQLLCKGMKKHFNNGRGIERDKTLGDRAKMMFRLSLL